MIDSGLFKSVIDRKNSAVVICDLSHRILYMNPFAVEQYAAGGGEALIGRNLMDCHSPNSQEKIRKVVDWFRADASHDRMFISHNVKHNRDVYMVALRDETGELIGYCERHAYRTPEHEKPYDFGTSAPDNQ